VSQAQWYPREKLLALQSQKLRRLLHHAYENVPFYRRRFDAAGVHKGDLNDGSALNCLPLLTKKEINENRGEMVAQNKAGGRMIKNSTSGSTGEALYFYTDMRSWAARRAVVIRNQRWLGVDIGDRSASLWGAPVDINKSNALRGRAHRWFNNYTFLSSYNLSGRALQNYVDVLNRFKPILLTSYPGPLCELARFMLDQKLSVPSVKAIISSAETLYPWQKDLAETAFSCPVFNRYGCREFGDIAHECKHRQGLHINAERVVLEVLDEKHQPSPLGVTGELVVTDLDNYGMPLIRYRIGDMGKLATQQCSCGRESPMLAAVEGRTLDVIRTPNGNAVGGTFWTILLKSKPGIKAFQLIQEHTAGITIRYIRDASVALVPVDYFKAKIQELCGDRFQVFFQEVDELEKTSSGKTRIVISRLNQQSVE
jgi:phenylacetate-CoA ligase